MSVNRQLVHVFIIHASCLVCGGDALLSGNQAVNVQDREVTRSAHFATFEIQQLSGYYVSLTSIDDAQKRIVPAGNKYHLKITVNVLADGKFHDEKCKAHVTVQKLMKLRDMLNYYKCNGILGGFTRYVKDPEPDDF